MVIGRAACITLVPPTEAAILLVAFDFPICSHDFMPLIYRPFELRWSDPVVVEINAHPVGVIHSDLNCVVSIYSLPRESLFLPNSRQRTRLGMVIVMDQINPMRANITERIALLRPLKRAGRYFQWLFQISSAIKRLANPLLNIITHSQVV